jgi:phosphohistidine phosphatase
MHVYILRHGNAGDPGQWPGDDRERPLSEEGRKEMRAVAKGLDWLDLKIDTVITSPLVRAQETADFVRQALHPSHYDTSQLLEPGCNLRALARLLALYPQSRELMIVGHEPDFGEIIASLIGAIVPGKIQLKKAACCCIKLDTEAGSLTAAAGELAGKGVLVWHLPPRVLTRLG